MKTLKLIAVGIILLVSSSIHAQVSVNVNIGTPPAWGPVGYSNVDYYYLPDIEAYYDIRASRFIYFSGGRWIRARYLPGPYRNYDLYGGYKVVLNDYHGRTPYIYFKDHKVKYHKGYHGAPQRTIGNRGDKHDYKHDYKEDKHWDKHERKHDKHEEKGHGKGHGKH